MTPRCPHGNPPGTARDCACHADAPRRSRGVEAEVRMLQGDIAYLRAVLHRALNCLDRAITTVQADPYSPPEPATPWDLEAAQIVTDLVRDPRGGGEMSYPFSRTSSWVGPGSHALAQAQAEGYRRGVASIAYTCAICGKAQREVVPDDVVPSPPLLAGVPVHRVCPLCWEALPGAK